MPQTHAQTLRSAKAADALAPSLRDEVADAWRTARISPFWPAVFVSVAIHVAALASMSPGGETPQRGGGGTERDAVGVEMITLAALESLAAKSAAAAAGTPGTDAANAPDQMAAIAPPATPMPETSQPVIEAPPVQGADELPQAKPADVQNVHEPTSIQAASIATFAASSPEALAQDGVAAATASPGDMTQFEIEVRDALGRNRPAFPGATGHVEVVFGLSAFGDLRSVSITRSSGNDKLDKIVLRTIKATRFPLPPAGMSDLQRSFSVPFDFQRVQFGRNKTRRG